ncbi:hypothetical protein Plhal304r1_c085g0168811 [Plasmopara halstedii]
MGHLRGDKYLLGALVQIYIKNLFSIHHQVVSSQWVTMTKKRKDNRYVYITERTKYLHHAIPPIDTVVEEDKIRKNLTLAKEAGNWKLEAQALMQLGQILKWRGQEEQGKAYQIQASSVLRAHTFAADNEYN